MRPANGSTSRSGASLSSFYSPHQSALWAKTLRSDVSVTNLTLYLGCFVESDPPLFDIQLEARSNVRKCASLALQRGVDTFALREHGECWVARRPSLSTFDISQYGESDQCSVDCDYTRISRTEGLQYTLAGQLCGNTMVNSVYRLQDGNSAVDRSSSSILANPWLMERMSTALVVPAILFHDSIRRSRAPAVFQLRAPSPSLQHGGIQIQLNGLLHAKLHQYARFLHPPWQSIPMPPVPHAFQPLACDLDMCRTMCCCHPCLATYHHPPADNQLLFPAPLLSLGPTISQADAQLNQHSWEYFNSSSSVAPPPSPSLPTLPRLALLLSGEMRSFASTLPWTKYHLLDPAPYPVDVFVHAWLVESSSHMAEVLQANGVEAAGLLVEPVPPFPRELAGVVDCRKADAVDNTVLVLSSESLRRAHRLKRLEEQRLGGKYSWVARMRLDMLPRHNFWPEVAQLMGWPLPSNAARHSHTNTSSEPPAQWNLLRAAAVPSDAMAVEHLVYPACGHGGGLNDQFAMGTSDAMHGYCEKPRYIHRCMLWGLTAGWHPECCHLAALDTVAEVVNLQVSELPVCYAIIRPAGFDRRKEKVSANMCQFKARSTAMDCCANICSPHTDTCLPSELREPHDTHVRCVPGESEAHCSERVQRTHAC